MSQKNSDGIRRKGQPAPIRLAPKHAESSPAAESVEPVAEETTFHWEEEGAPEKIYYREAAHTELPGVETASKRAFFSRLAEALPFKNKGRFGTESGQSAALDEWPNERTVGRSPAVRRWSRWGMLAGGGIVVMLFVLVSTSFARLTVMVKPRVEETAIENLGTLLDTSVSKVLFSQKVIPAERLVFSKTVTKEFTATGLERVAERARGKARIHNAFNASPQTLVAGTRFTTDAGMVYRIQKSIVVPGAKIEAGKVVPQSIEAELVADSIGESGNHTGETKLKIPGFQGSPRYDGFYAVAPQGFSGGFKGEATVASKDDVKIAEEEMSKAVFEELEVQMARKAPPGLHLMRELREVQIVKMGSPRPGTPGERFSVAATASGKALVFREEDAIALMKSFALEESKDQELVEGSARLAYTVKTVDFEKGRAEVAVAGSLKTKTRIPEQELAALVKGKKEGSVIELFKTRRELASFNLAFFPPWRSKAPSDPSKIRFRVE